MMIVGQRCHSEILFIFLALFWFIHSAECLQYQHVLWEKPTRAPLPQARRACLIRSTENRRCFQLTTKRQFTTLLAENLPKKDDNQIARNSDSLVRRLREYWSQFRQKFIHQTLYHLRRFLRRIAERHTIYVLECENGKYYVGSTTRRKQRFQQHLGKKGGSVWTRENKPVRILKEYKRIPSFYALGLESRITAECMVEFGVNNVRGAMFSDTRPYTQSDLDVLTRFLGHYNGMNYKHVRSILQDTLPSNKSAKKKQKEKKSKGKKEAGPMDAHDKTNDRCFRCGQLGHWAQDCPNGNGPICYVCGKVGHIVADCPHRKMLLDN